MMSLELRQAAWDECEELVAALRALDTALRFHPERHSMLWKPKFSEMPADTQALIREHGIGLVRVFVPYDTVMPVARPGWFMEGLTGCIGCGASTAKRDPLGQPRHDRCGWLGQGLDLRMTPDSASVARLKRQGRH